MKKKCLAKFLSPFIGFIGASFEYFDLFYWGYIAPRVQHLFLPHVDGSTWSALHYFLTIIVGRIAGSLIFGYLGDRYGRRFSLVLSIVLIILPSFLLGMLPTIYTLGILSTYLFLFLRFLIASSGAGENTGLLTFILEESHQKTLGKTAGIISAGCALGVTLASFTIYSISTNSNENNDLFYNWFWRIPMLFGLIGIIIPICMRYFLPKGIPLQKESKAPLFILLKKYKKNFLQATTLTPLAPALSIGVFGFIPTFGTTELGIPESTGFLINTIGLIIFGGFAPVFGYLSDRWGRKLTLRWISIIFAITTFPIFYLMFHGGYITYICTYLYFCWLSSSYYGVTLVACLECYPKRVRYTGYSLSYNIMMIIFATPAYNFLMKDYSNQPHYLIPAASITLGAIIIFISSKFFNPLLLKD